MNEKKVLMNPFLDPNRDSAFESLAGQGDARRRRGRARAGRRAREGDCARVPVARDTGSWRRRSRRRRALSALAWIGHWSRQAFPLSSPTRSATIRNQTLSKKGRRSGRLQFSSRWGPYVRRIHSGAEIRMRQKSTQLGEELISPIARSEVTNPGISSVVGADVGLPSTPSFRATVDP
jgi:hypothetical protein